MTHTAASEPLPHASKHAKEVIGVELNKDAVRDAGINAKRNGSKNFRAFQGDAGAFMVQMAEAGEQADVVFMDPPRQAVMRLSSHPS